MREYARTAVAAWHEAKSDVAAKSGNRSQKDKEKLPLKYDPYKTAFEALAGSGYPEDLIEFKRRIALYARM